MVAILNGEMPSAAPWPVAAWGTSCPMLARTWLRWTSSGAWTVADVVGSVAHYLARHDWQPGQPVLLPAIIDPDQRDAVRARLDGGISERRPLDAWEADGVTVYALPSELPGEPVGIVLLESTPIDGDETATYWIACPNFYAITRYNRSRLYAAAVFQLAQAVRAARDGGRR